MDMNDTGNRIMAAIVVALLIIGAWYLGTTIKVPHLGGTAVSTTTPATTGARSATGTPPAGGSLVATVEVGGQAVQVKDQPAGSSVAVASVTLRQPGWVAIRDSNGLTLGAALFTAGRHVNVEVPLLRDTTAGEHYQALIYYDNGDKTFDLHTDTLVMNQDGTVAGTTFTALSAN